MTQELLPCPFCGDAPYEHPQQVNFTPKTNTEWWAVWCEGCKATGPERADKAEAITAWNTRAATIPDPSAYIAAARGMREAAERLSELCIDADLWSPVFDDAQAAFEAFDAAQGEQ